MSRLDTAACERIVAAAAGRWPYPAAGRAEATVEKARRREREQLDYILNGLSRGPHRQSLGAAADALRADLESLSEKARRSLHAGYDFRAWFATLVAAVPRIRDAGVDEVVRILRAARAFLLAPRARHGGTARLSVTLGTDAAGILRIPHLDGIVVLSDRPRTSVTVIADDDGLTLETPPLEILRPGVAEPRVSRNLCFVPDLRIEGTDIVLEIPEDVGRTSDIGANLATALRRLRAVWPEGADLVSATTHRIDVVDEPRMMSRSYRDLPARTTLGTHPKTTLDWGVAILHEAMHLFLYEETRHSPYLRRPDVPVESPWKGCPRPAYLVLHALATFSTQTVYLARAALASDSAAGDVGAAIASELDRLRTALSAILAALEDDTGPIDPRVLELLAALRDMT